MDEKWEMLRKIPEIKSRTKFLKIKFKKKYFQPKKKKSWPSFAQKLRNFRPIFASQGPFLKNNIWGSPAIVPPSPSKSELFENRC